MDEEELEELEAWPSHLYPKGSDHRGFVLLQPGQQGLPDFFVGTAIRMNDSVFIVEANLNILRQLAAHPGVVYVEAPRPIGEDLDTSVAATNANVLWSTPLGMPSLTGMGVIVGIVDTDGLDWKLTDFQLGNRTRIFAIWDQSLRRTGREISPSPYNYGVEYDQTAIDTDLSGGTPIRHRCANGSHATHVAGIAAGNGNSTGPNSTGGTFAPSLYVGVAHEATIIYVKVVKNPATALTSSDRVAEAIQYIFDKAGQRPCVINVSLGSNGGAHDSESVVERTIDRMLEACGRVLVKSAGNERNWDCHASTVLTAADPRCTLLWQFGDGIGSPGSGKLDRTSNEMDIWYSSRDSLRVQVEDPSGNSTTFTAPGPYGKQVFTLGAETVTICSQRFHPLNGAGYVHIHVASTVGGHLTSGMWKVVVEAIYPNEIKDGRTDAWVERDRRDRANFYADQSFLRSYVTAEDTISPPGTIRRGITVGNYDHKTNSAVSSSSNGPTRDGRDKPDLVAPGSKIWSSGALGNQRNPAGGFFPVRLEKTGSSMSAPHITGVCAQILQAFPDLTSAQVRAALIASAASMGGTPSFDPQLGFGKVDAREADRILR
jgi:hypothetical protein